MKKIRIAPRSKEVKNYIVKIYCDLQLRLHPMNIPHKLVTKEIQETLAMYMS